MQHQWRWSSADADNNYFQCQKCLGVIGFNKPGIGWPAADQNGPVPNPDGSTFTFEDYYDPDDCPGAATSADLMASLTKALFSVKPADQLVAEGTLTQTEVDQLNAVVAEVDATAAAASATKK